MSAVHRFQMRAENASLLPAEFMFSVLFAGPIPPDLGNLAALQVLFLARNDLGGEWIGEVSCPSIMSA